MVKLWLALSLLLFSAAASSGCIRYLLRLQEMSKLNPDKCMRPHKFSQSRSYPILDPFGEGNR